MLFNICPAHAGWSWESLRGWSQFLKLGIPGAAMLCFDWISFEISAFVLGSIDEVQLAVNAILFNITVLLFMVSQIKLLKFLVVLIIPSVIFIFMPFLLETHWLID